VALLSEWTEIRPEENDVQLLEKLAEAGQSEEFSRFAWFTNLITPFVCMGKKPRLTLFMNARLFFARDGPPDLFPEVSNATKAFSQALTNLSRNVGFDFIFQGVDVKGTTMLKQWMAAV